MVVGGVLIIAIVVVLLVVLLSGDDSHPIPSPPAPVPGKLVYVFEIVRHGARAPELPDPSLNKWGFKVSDGQLTPMGMR